MDSCALWAGALLRVQVFLASRFLSARPLLRVQVSLGRVFWGNGIEVLLGNPNLVSVIKGKS